MTAKIEARQTASIIEDGRMQATQTPQPHQAAGIGVHPEMYEPAHIRQRISILSGALLSPLSLMLLCIFMQATFGIQTASASSHLGILGNQAPELDLDTWIDGQGKKMAPIHLGDHRGKIIYLYFYQDW